MLRKWYIGLIIGLLSCVMPAANAASAQPERAGSAALAEGAVTVTGSDGSQRALHDGDSVFAGDTITTGSASYADLDLEDGGRVLLRPGTTFNIEQFHFDAEAHDANASATRSATPASADTENGESAIFRLIKGGLRAIDGLIGQTHPQSYAMKTPVATIGIRGTEYDVRYCDSNCQDESENGSVPDNGLYTAVSQGAIGIQTETGVSVVNKGGYGFLAGRHMKFRRLNRLPRALQHMALPARFRARADRMRKLIRERRARRWKALRARRHRSGRRLRRRYQIGGG